MEYLLAFGAAFGLSFLGMLPPGMLNMTVVSLSMKKSIKIAATFAFGAVFVEFFQVLFIIKFIDSVNKYLDGNLYVYWGAFFILLGLGVSYLLIKPKKIERKTSIKGNYIEAFFYGVSLSVVNVLAYVFWLMSGIYFLNEGILYFDTSILVVYSFGVMSGAFFVYIMYAFLGDRILKRYNFFANNINKIIAVIFFFLALLQLFKVL